MSDIAKLIIGAGERLADIRYASGLSTPDDFLYLESEAGKFVICSSLEFARAKVECKPGVTVLNTADFADSANLGVIAEFAQNQQITKFLVPADFPLKLADDLRMRQISVEPLTGAFFAGREFKTRDEVNQIIRAQRAAERGMRRAWEILGEASVNRKKILVWHGETLSSEILRTEIDLELLRAGTVSGNTICAGGVQGSQPHNLGSGPLAADAPIVIDIFPRDMATGYWGDLTRTVVKGKAGATVKKAYDAVKAARDLAQSLLKPGAIPAEVTQKATAIMEAAGFSTGRDDAGIDYGFFHSLGHGVGLDIHELPRLSVKNHQPLQGGEVVTVEPGLYYAAWGGIRLENLVSVIPGGIELLTQIGDLLEID